MKHLPKQIITWTACIGLRLIPFRPANAEPLLATLMPFSTRFGLVANLTGLVGGIVAYDALTAGIGSWTWSVALTYALVALASQLYFSRHTGSRTRYVGFSVIATLFFDIVTGLVIGPIVGHQPFMVALAGQIPFTMAHLAGNVLLAAFVSPLIQRFVVENTALELAIEPSITKRLA